MAPQPGKVIVECPSCQQLLNIPADRRKLQLTCPKCRATWLWSSKGTSQTTGLPADSADSSQNGLAKALAVISGPLKEYWQGLSRWNRPGDLAGFIKSQQPMSADLIQYVLGAAGVTALVARVIGYEEGSLEFVNIPIVNEIIVVVVFLAGGLISSLMCHKPLRLAGGRGMFRQTCLSFTYVAVTFLPFIVLAEGIYLRVTHNPLPRSWYTGPQLIYSSPLLARVHEISYGKALAVIASVAVALLIAVVAVVLLRG